MILKQFEKQGYARLGLDTGQAMALADLHREARRFSNQPPEFKARFQVPKLNNGYRPLGAIHAGDPDQADVNDSFLFWSWAQSAPFMYQGAMMLLDCLATYQRLVCVPLMQRLVSELQGRYRYEHDLPFEAASVLQCNSFHVPTDRELLQTRHEDGVVATILAVNAPGLELDSGEQLTPVTPGPDEVIIMPGGILEAMTGGEFPAMYHQARNHGYLGRTSILYFSNFNFDRHITPFVDGVDQDIAALIQASPDMFGQPDGFYHVDMGEG